MVRGVEGVYRELRCICMMNEHNNDDGSVLKSKDKQEMGGSIGLNGSGISGWTTTSRYLPTYGMGKKPIIKFNSIDKHTSMSMIQQEPRRTFAFNVHGTPNNDI